MDHEWSVVETCDHFLCSDLSDGWVEYIAVHCNLSSTGKRHSIPFASLHLPLDSFTVSK